MKSVVLLSAGLDSTVNLYEAHKAGEVTLALTFDYGQRAVRQEINQSQKIAQSLGIPHQSIALHFFKDFGTSSLVDMSLQLPLNEQIKINDLKISEKTAKSVWVPNRNGIFLNIAAGFAEALGAQFVIPGFNLEEAATFPDNTQGFLDVLTESFLFSTSNHVKAHCFTTRMNKTDIVKRGLELQVNFRDIWPCYQAFDFWCGQCESCQRAQRAFQENGLEFPL